MGDYKAEYNAKTFEGWWLKNAREPLNVEFKKFDLEFKKLFELASNNYFDHRGPYKWVVDGLNQSKYLPKSINASIKAETRLYLQILSRALISGNLAPPAVKSQQAFNYLEYATIGSENKLNYIPLYKNTPKEIQHLNDLFLMYSLNIMNQNTNFDNYIAQSKKIDTAINDIFVLVGLKKVSVEASAIEDLPQPTTPSATGTENSDKVYEDVEVKNPTYKQRMTIAAVKGLRQVESEIRRFIRMKIMLSQSLELDTEEFMKDWNYENPTQLNSSKAKKIGPFGP